MEASKELLQQVDSWILAHRDEFIQDLQTLVNIKSVAESTPGEHPFGEGCAEVLDKALEMSSRYGLDTKNYEYYCGRASYGDGDKEIGIFAHLDVVPEGNDWIYEPYHAVVKDGFMIGRGTADNKSSAIAEMYTLRILKDLGIKTRHKIFAFYGCNEEVGMKDMDYYLEHEKAPVFGFTPDAGFPLCYAEKGIITADFVSREIDGNLVDFTGGHASNMVPDYAKIVLSGVGEEQVKAAIGSDEHFTLRMDNGNAVIEAKGVSAHAAGPDNGVNAIYLLCSLVLENNLITGSAKDAVAFVQHVLSDCHGKSLQVPFEDDITGIITHAGGMIRFQDKKLRLNINMRYPVKADQELLEKNIFATVEGAGFTVENFDNSTPQYVPVDHPAIQALMDVCREYIDPNSEPYTMGGGTYARKMPMGVAFGAGLPNTPKLFDIPGHGSAHGPDEYINIDMVLKAIRIFIIALLRLDELEF